MWGLWGSHMVPLNNIEIDLIHWKYKINLKETKLFFYNESFIFPMPKKITLFMWLLKINDMWFLANFSMISVFTIPNMFIQIYSCEQQFQDA